MDAVGAGALLGVMVVVLGGIGRTVRRSDTKKSAPLGTTHLETVQANLANSTIKEWAKHGWTVAGQSSAKSFGKQAQVTITFQRNVDPRAAPPARGATAPVPPHTTAGIPARGESSAQAEADIQAQREAIRRAEAEQARQAIQDGLVTEEQARTIDETVRRERGW
jgi:hypothetical protein